MPARKRWPQAKRAALLMRRPLRRLAAAALRDALGGHPRGLTGLDRREAVEAPIVRGERGRAPEERDVVRQRRGDVLIVCGIAREHAVVGDQAVPALGQEDFVAELDGPLGLAALDQVRVGLEDREELVRGGHRLALQDPPPRLRDHPINPLAIRGDLRRQGVHPDAGERIEARRGARRGGHRPGGGEHLSS